MRILTLIPGGIGEQILFFPTLASLQKQYPQAVIDVLVEQKAKSAYRVCPVVNEVLVFNYSDRNGLADYLNLLGLIRDREYEIAVSADSQWIVGFLQWLNGIPIRIGYQSQPSWFLTHCVSPKSQQYRAWMYHDLLQGLNIYSPCPTFEIAVPKEDIDWAEATQAQLGIQDSGYILIYGEINQANPNTYYPISQWQEIIGHLQEKQPSLPIVLLQLLEDIPWVSAMKQGYPQLKVVQPMDMGKLAAIIAGANLMIAPQSVPLQLAIAVRTYTIALMAKEQAILFLPPENEAYRLVESQTSQISDIPAESILEQIWRV